MSIDIRRGSSGDVAAVIELAGRLYRERGKGYTSSPAEPVPPQIVVESKAEAGELLLAEGGGELLGFAMVSQTGTIKWMTIHPAGFAGTCRALVGAIRAEYGRAGGVVVNATQRRRIKVALPSEVCEDGMRLEW